MTLEIKALNEQQQPKLKAKNNELKYVCSFFFKRFSCIVGLHACKTKELMRSRPYVKLST